MWILTEGPLGIDYTPAVLVVVLMLVFHRNCISISSKTLIIRTWRKCYGLLHIIFPKFLNPLENEYITFSRIYYFLKYSLNINNWKGFSGLSKLSIKDLLHFFPLNYNHNLTVQAIFFPCDSQDISKTFSPFIIYFLCRKSTYCLHYPFIETCLSNTNIKDISKEES